jgi:branched-chain amino acid transport system permease protein
MAVDVGSILVQGVLVSALYALVALGFTMIFGVGGVLNLAHGALVMAGAYVFAILSRDLFGIPALVHPYVALPIAILVTAVLSYLLYVGFVQFIEENPVVTFLGTVIVAVWFQDLIITLLNSTEFSISFVQGTLTIPGLGTEVVMIDVVGFLVSWLLIGLVWVYVTKTDGGRAIRATAMSERGAQLTGVNIAAVERRTWLIAGALAGTGGIFLGSVNQVSPTMWLGPLTLGFIIVVIGGIGSIKGSIVAAYLIGFLEMGTRQVLGDDFVGVLSLVVLVIVLLVMPQGLFGREFVHE